MSSFFSRSSILCSSLYILLSSSVTLSESSLPVDVAGVDVVDEDESMKPNNSVFEDGVGEDVSVLLGFDVLPNSTNPSRSVGTTTSCFGILTTPRLWSSRTSIILFFFLKSIRVLGWGFI